MSDSGCGLACFLFYQRSEIKMCPGHARGDDHLEYKRRNNGTETCEELAKQTKVEDQHTPNAKAVSQVPSLS